MKSAPPDPPLLHTPAEAAERLRVRESWLRRAVAQRSVPHRKVGKHLRFSNEDLEAIAAASAQPAIPTRPAPRRKAS